MRLQHTNLTHLMPFLIIRTHFEHGVSLMWAGSFGATYQKWLRKRVLVVRPLHLRFGVCFIPLNGDHVTRRLHQVILVFHGMNWPFTFAIFTGHFLPIWISSKTEKLPLPYDYDSPEAQIQPQEKRSLWHQASVLRSVVRYLENSLRCAFYPRYKKTNASSLIRQDITVVLWGASLRVLICHLLIC